MASPHDGEKQESCCWLWLANITMIHGPDECRSTRRIALRIVWLVAMLAALVALVVQVTSITGEYIKGGVGTQEKVWLPDNIPSIILCPQIRYLEGPGMSSDLADYIMGYFPLRALFEKPREPPVSGWAVQREEAKALLAKYNNSKVKLTMDLTDAPKFVWPEPSTFMVNLPSISKISTPQGICFMASSKGVNITPRNWAFAFYGVNVNTSMETQHSKGAYYYIHVGEMDDNRAAIDVPEGRIFVIPNRKYRLWIRATRRIAYPGIRKDRCAAYTMSDYIHCGQVLVDNMYGDIAGCTHGAPPSVKFEEVKADNYCNVYDHYAGLAREFAKLNAEGSKALETACNIPCVRTIYDVNLEVVPLRADRNYTRSSKVRVSLDSPDFSKEIIEYPIMPITDFLAALGGTFGLYFGASLLSFVQIFTAGLGAVMDARQNKVASKTSDSRQS